MTKLHTASFVASFTWPVYPSSHSLMISWRAAICAFASYLEPIASVSRLFANQHSWSIIDHLHFWLVAILCRNGWAFFTEVRGSVSFGLEQWVPSRANSQLLARPWRDWLFGAMQVVVHFQCDASNSPHVHWWPKACMCPTRSPSFFPDLQLCLVSFEAQW